jgi:Flp pilus assembly protein TadD
LYGFYKFTKDGYVQAREMFEQAIGLDPNDSRGHAALAYCDLNGALYGFVDRSEKLLANALASARRAVELDDIDGYAHKVLGIAYTQGRDFDQGRLAIDRALELNPSDATALIGVGFLLTLTGNPSEGIPHIEKGLQLNPRDPRNHHYFGFMARALYTARRYDEAVEWARKSLQRRPNQPEPHLILATSLGQLGQLEAARTELETCERLRPGYSNPSGWVHTYAGASDNDHFLEGLRKAGWEG